MSSGPMVLRTSTFMAPARPPSAPLTTNAASRYRRTLMPRGCGQLRVVADGVDAAADLAVLAEHDQAEDDQGQRCHIIGMVKSEMTP